MYKVALLPGYAAWNKARTNDDWALFSPVLTELVDLRKEAGG